MERKIARGDKSYWIDADTVVKTKTGPTCVGWLKVGESFWMNNEEYYVPDEFDESTWLDEMIAKKENN